MADDVRPGLRERKRQSTRLRIEQVALDLFDRRGFDETTVDDIAAAAEVSRASVFRYFGSKDDIVYAPEGELLEVVRGLLRQTPGLSLEEVVVRYATHVDREVTDLSERAAVIARTPKLIERFAHVRTRWELAVADELAARRGGRSTRTLEDRAVAAAAMSTLFVAFLQWAVEGGKLTPLVRRAIKVVPGVFAPVTPEDGAAK